MSDFNNELIDRGARVDFYEHDIGVRESAATFSAKSQQKGYLGGGGDAPVKEVKAPNEASLVKKDFLPLLEDIQAHVRNWEDPNVSKEYVTAIRPFYKNVEVDTLEGKRTQVVRIGIMDITHTFPESSQVISNVGVTDTTFKIPETEQEIHSIGVQHDKSPYSEMNKQLKAKVQDYTAKTPPEQRLLLLEGFNFPEGQELPREVIELV